VDFFAYFSYTVIIAYRQQSRYSICDSATQMADKFRFVIYNRQYGRVSSHRVLDAQKDMFDAQNAATEALVNYMVATLNLYRDTEVLQVRPDGMWEKRGMMGEGRWSMGDGR